MTSKTKIPPEVDYGIKGSCSSQQEQISPSQSGFLFSIGLLFDLFSPYVNLSFFLQKPICETRIPRPGVMAHSIISIGFIIFRQT